ncbi:hypothetical protein CHLRE_12g522850v5 [Chlamydomonas reinhardtii]|uniref:RNA helicase n=1 Tax=Chlamydomonas reinhardtii TaxID=3055 RepID=A0A2K3D464_CHLRE|nr:uncharacterized protein CHLRE_12g522850v5 [Chlamydomonas reinhardtii]PNW75333.1 hypothetical protein CHLRE_12g522850v5 [Chlamydomonas reinhardtii]
MDGHGQKRKFPYHSDVPSFEVKQSRPESHPGREQNDPRVFQQPSYNYYDAPTSSTDFTKWTPDEIKSFLDRRGGDFDDCNTFEQLVERAVEVEINTGPAVKPGAEEAQQELEEWERQDFAQACEDAAAEAAAAAAAAQRRGAAAAAARPHAAAPAAAAPAATGKAGGAGGGGGEDEEYDPLEAFMAEINSEVAANKPTASKAKPDAALACDEAADPATEYMAVRTPKAAAAAAAGGGGGYDSDEEVYAAAKAIEAGGGDDDEDDAAAGGRRGIEALAPLDHTAQVYAEFAKDFYEEAPDIAKMTDPEVAAYRRELEVRVSGFDVPRPVRSFAQCGFDADLMAAIKKHGYEKPTPIQCQALPVALSGRDVLGIAKTGSGKTAAFVLPMLVHIMDQPELAKGEGPIGLLVAPTRELAEQIHKETRRFSKPYGLRVAAAFGGLSKYEQFKALKGGSEVAVATPGRMIDLVKMKACSCARVTYLVFDEADRMFDMGFEPQVRSLLGQVRPDRQTLLFSATMPRKVEALVADALASPVRITVGAMGVANADVIQTVELVPDDDAKAAWLRGAISGLVDEGEVIVFAGQRQRVEGVAEALKAAGVRVGAIHGEMDQYTRMGVLDHFKNGTTHVLVATDIAARGLDIRTIKTVVNYDAARDLDTHIHRVGRTGRAGDKEGRAISLLTPGDARFAAQLLQSLTAAGQEVPPALAELAMRDPKFRQGNSRTKGGRGGGGGKGRRPQVGGSGLGFGAGGGAASAATGSFASGPRAAGATGAKTFVQLPGFAKSTEDYEHEPSAAAGAPDPAPPPALPPPPPLPPGGAVAAAAAAAGGPATGMTSRAEVVKSMHVGRFKSSFVSSGTTGGDLHAGPTIIMPKSSASAAPAAPPPLPVTAVPHYLQQGGFGAGGGGSRFGPPRTFGAVAGGAGAAAAASFGAGSGQDAGGGAGGYGGSGGSSSSSYGGGGGSGASYRNMPPPPSLNAVPPPRSFGGGGGGGGGSRFGAPPAAAAAPAMNAAAAAAAIAAAQAIAARLAAQAQGGAPPQ